MPVEYLHRTLPNGLTILAERDASAHSAAAGFFVKTGARDEDPALMGVSHFLEHMMFKGTADLSAADLNRRFDEIGARNNAYTSNELTCFHAHVLPEFLPEVLDILSRMMRPALREDDFATEKGVILEEIAMYKDNPFWVLYEEAMERHFRGHPLGHRVLGTPDTIRAMPRDGMAAYFRQRYSADNTVLALSGRLDFDRVCDQALAQCGGWERTDAARDSRSPQQGAGAFDLADEKVSRAYLLGFAPGPAVRDDRRYAAALLAQVLGAPDNSRLHWALIEPGVAEEAQASYDANDGCGQFLVYASGDPSRADEIWQIMEREVLALEDSLTEDDLARLRGKMVTAATVGGERPADRMQRIGRQWTALGEYRPLEDELDRINRVTLADLREICREFPLRPVTVGRLLPI